MEGRREDNRTRVTLEVNGRAVAVEISETALLLNVLRDQLELPGTKYACGIGECGACSVFIDGRLALSCLTLAKAVDGHRVETVEAVATRGIGRLVAEAMLEEAAVQCGYCTPGMVMAAAAGLAAAGGPVDEATAREMLRGNLCRCTGYAALVRAVMAASRRLPAALD